MADNKQGGGKKGRKIGRNAKKCEAYAISHGVYGKRRFSRSKEHRSCGPLGYKQRADAIRFNSRKKSA